MTERQNKRNKSKKISQTERSQNNGTTRKKKPNILIIWGDDIGWFNVSAYNHGIMGYRTPNIDRVAKEGAMFTDWYGQQSCTAGRAALHHRAVADPHRADQGRACLEPTLGLQPEDPTIAELLKPLGYVTGQFGKNHLGDRDEFLPTVHGFDEFFGNLYHLNAEEEPENADYPKASEPRLQEAVRPARRAAQSRSTARAGRRSRTPVRSPGSAWRPSTRRSPMRALGFIEQSDNADKPFFLLVELDPHARLDAPEGGVEGQDRPGRLSRRHGRARRPRSASSSPSSIELGIADNTIVMYSTDNGAEKCTWPDGGIDAVPRREGHELGRRLARAVRDPLAGRDQAGNRVATRSARTRTCSRRCWPRPVNRISSRNVRRLQSRRQDLQGSSRRVQPHSLSERRGGKGPRPGFLYWGDEGDLMALRYGNWKIHFAEQTHEGFAALGAATPRS